ncbi:MAG: DUF4760 domain-containing protein [Vicinamibacterales bacterium]
MATPVESATLILKLFELRREPVLREARAWFLRDFNPLTLEEALTLAGGPRNDWFRMVVGYWDMAASFVVHGAIDSDMFRAANTEMVATFAKLEPFIADIRRVSRIPEFAANIETVLRGQAGVEERMAQLRDQFRKLAGTAPAPSPHTSS